MKESSLKKVSIIMGIYNCENTVGESIESIIGQTYPHWELILCDDGSSDGTYARAKEYADRYPEQIILLKNEKNLGLNMTLNKCLEIATGEYIARQDGDDISLPERFEKEVAFLEEHPEYAIVSAAMVHVDEQGPWGTSDFPRQPTPADFMRGSPIAHAPCMIRQEAFRAVGGYSVSPKLLRVEDYHLWYKMYMKGYYGYNMPEALYHCSDDRDAQGRRNFQNRLNECRMKWMIFRDMKPGLRTLPYLARPLLVGMLPGPLYRFLHRRKLQTDTQNLS